MYNQVSLIYKYEFVHNSTPRVRCNLIINAASQCTAVQHERGPRKPKVHQSHASLHHGHPPSSHSIPVSDSKLSPPGNHAMHHHQHAAAAAAAAGLHFPFFSPPHPLKGMTLPPPPQQLSSVPPTSGSPPGSSALDSLGPNGPPPMFHPQAMPPPPGLLQILMSAEKCQVSHFRNLEKVNF